MINKIHGILTGIRENGLFLLTGGIEWSVLVPARQLAMLPDVNSELSLYIYLHHREDQMVLFGFLEEQERSLFLELIKVSGIGPKQALKILSAVDYKTFTDCLDKEDVGVLSSLPGVGAKTAQKIILALRGKLKTGTGEQPARYKDIITALTDMGFEKKKAEEAVRIAAEESDLSDLEEEKAEQLLFKQAIVLLSQM